MYMMSIAMRAVKKIPMIAQPKDCEVLLKK